MKKTVKYSIMAAFAVTLGIAASVTQAQTSADRVYAIDGRNEVVTSGANLCWRTGFWTPAAAAKDPAGCQCDKDILEKSICEPKVAATSTAPRAATGTKPDSAKIALQADTLFDFDKAVLKPAGMEALDHLVQRAGANRFTQFAHQYLIVVQVVDGIELRAKYFADAVQVVQVGA